MSSNKFSLNDDIASSNASDLRSVQVQLPVYNWSMADYPKICEHLDSIDWHALFGYHFDANSLCANLSKLFGQYLNCMCLSNLFLTIKNIADANIQSIYESCSLEKLQFGEQCEIPNLLT